MVPSLVKSNFMHHLPLHGTNYLLSGGSITVVVWARTFREILFHLIIRSSCCLMTCRQGMGSNNRAPILRTSCYILPLTRLWSKFIFWCVFPHSSQLARLLLRRREQLLLSRFRSGKSCAHRRKKDPQRKMEHERMHGRDVFYVTS